MKSIKRIIAFALILCMVLSLCACKSSEAKAVEKKIEAIGEITPESESIIKEINDAYNSLSADEQASISNYEKLENANEELSNVLVAKWCNEAYSIITSKIHFYMEEYSIPMVEVMSDIAEMITSADEYTAKRDSLNQIWTESGISVGDTSIYDTRRLISKVQEKDPNNECAILLTELREKALSYQEFAESLYDLLMNNSSISSLKYGWGDAFFDYQDNYPDLDARVSEAMPTV